eukprot:SAG31_NODE_36480_length_313_cov_0.616822_1_plen_44_part_10
MNKFLYWCPVPGHPAPGSRFNLSGIGGQSCFWCDLPRIQNRDTS